MNRHHISMIYVFLAFPAVELSTGYALVYVLVGLGWLRLLHQMENT